MFTNGSAIGSQGLRTRLNCPPDRPYQPLMSEQENYSAEREVFTPSQLTRQARDVIESAFALIWIEGEISNFSRPASGHLYFSLKDAGAQVRCAMFKPKSTWLRFKPVDGMQVLVRARVSLYEARGEFQILVDHMEEAGEGALKREFERLKAQLTAEGLFDASRKRALPRLPRRIGVITSATGAAVRDVLSVLGRRFPLADVEVIAVPVQGREAPPAIVAALIAASRAKRHDVLLVTRGGGSIEDLWAFNDEGVARAIHASTIPVVSAIGHEVDFTIADFVADLRAATPSAAAELLVPDAIDLARHLAHRMQRMELLVRRALQGQAQKLDRLLARLDAHRPQARLALGASRLDALRRRLQHVVVERRHRAERRVTELATRLERRHPQRQLERARQVLHDRRERLQRAMTDRFGRRRALVAELGRTLHAVSPLATLSRGYAILLDEQGRVVRATGDTRAGARVVAKLHDGDLTLKVE